MAKYTHSKYKNTYLIFEFLIRQLTNEMMSGVAIKESNAYQIIQKNFSSGLLKEELTLYQALVDNKLSKTYSAEILLNECIKRYKSLNKRKLDAMRYNLVKKIKECYDIDKLFSTQVEQYKEAGSVYFLFETVKNRDILNESKFAGDIMGNLLSPKEKKKSIQIFECIKEASQEDREMAFKMMVNSFNKKFSSALNENQKEFIQDYTYNHTNENGWIKKHLNRIKRSIISESKNLDDSIYGQNILKIKLKECVKVIDYIAKKKVLNEDDHTKVIQSYKLIDQLNELKRLL